VRGRDGGDLQDLRRWVGHRDGSFDRRVHSRPGLRRRPKPLRLRHAPLRCVPPRHENRTSRPLRERRGRGRDAHSQLSRDRRLQELPVRLRQLRSRREGTGSLEIRPGERRRRALVRQGHDLRQRDGPLPTGITCTSRNRNPEEGELFVDELERVPDGLAFDAAGNLYIACYEPSRIYRVSPERDTSLYRRPRSAHPAPSNKLCVSRRTALLHIQPGPVAHNADRSPLRGPSIALNGSLAWGIEPYRL
jgi:hypothetical protein